MRAYFRSFTVFLFQFFIGSCYCSIYIFFLLYFYLSCMSFAVILIGFCQSCARRMRKRMNYSLLSLRNCFLFPLFFSLSLHLLRLILSVSFCFPRHWQKLSAHIEHITTEWNSTRFCMLFCSAALCCVSSNGMAEWWRRMCFPRLFHDVPKNTSGLSCSEQKRNERETEWEKDK